MRIEDLEARWHAMSEEVMSGVKESRLQHPKATFNEMGSELGQSAGVSSVRGSAATTRQGVADGDDAVRPRHPVGTSLCGISPVSDGAFPPG